MRPVCLLLLAACVPDAPPDADAPDVQRLRCTTASAVDGGTVHVAWRGTVTAGGALRLDRDATHGDLPAWADPPMRVQDDAVITGTFDGDQLDVQGADAHLTLARAGDAVWFAGTATLPDGDHDAWCWAGDLTPQRYADGACTDDDGIPGRTVLPAAVVRETGDAECADLSGQDLNEGDLGYPILDGYDLRGADLSRSALFFASLLDARLQGADLADLDFGYAEVAGRVDAHTTLPPSCEISGDTADCWR